MEIKTNKLKIIDNNIKDFYSMYLLKIPFNKNQSNKIFTDIVSLLNTISFENILSLYRNDKRFTMHILVEKGVDINPDMLFSNLQVLEKFQRNYGNISIEKVNIEEIDNSAILNCLLGAMNYNEKDNYISNGKLYEFIRHKYNRVITYEYNIKDMYLTCNVVTFKEKNEYDNGPFYNFSTHHIKRSINNCEYIRKSVENKKNVESFWNPTSYGTYTNSKLYKITNMIKRFNEYYNGKIKIDFEYMEMCDNKFFDKIDSNNAQIKSIFKDVKINVINNLIEVNDIEKVKSVFEYCKVKYEISNQFSPFEYNVNIINDKEIYNEANKEDKYEISSEYIIQNLTCENFFSNSKLDEITKYKIPVLLSELLMKKDLKEQTLSLYEDNEIFDNYIFGMHTKIDDEYITFEMDINKGSFNISDFASVDVKKREYIYIKNKKSNKLSEIKDTNIIPLANLDICEKHFLDLNESRETKKLFKIFENLNERYFEIIKKLRYEFAFDEFVSLNQVVKFLDKEKLTNKEITSSQITSFINSVRSVTNGKIDMRLLWRNSLSSLVTTYNNFKYMYKENRLYYYCGFSNSIPPKFVRGFVVRAVELEEQYIEDYFNLLNVDNIRFNQPTVIPYPFKYLREYVDKIKRENK